MVPKQQIISLSLGAGVVAVGAVAAWQGWLPGVPRSKPPIMAPVAQIPPAPPAPSPAPTPAPAPTDQQQAGTLPAAPAAPPAPGPAPAPAAKPQPIIPQFDTVRVEPSGDTVVAGHGAPKAKVDLMNAESVLGDAKADDGGDFVIVPQPLAPGTYVLGLRSTSGTQLPVNSTQTITVSVPAKGQPGLVVALTEPGKPSKILTDPTAEGGAPPPAPAPEKPPAEAQPAPPPAATTTPPAVPPKEAPPPKPAEAKPSVVIKTAEVDKGAFYAAGFAPPGTHVRIYLNGAALADVTADAAGNWSLTIGKGMTPGHYVIRADALDGQGKVIARAEVPFDVPVAVAAADAPTAKSEPAPQPALQPTPAPKPAELGSAAPPPPAASGAGGAPAAGTAGGQPQPSATASADADASHAVVPEISTATVTRGDSLWRISRKTLGFGVRYTLIYQANAKQIRDPNLIYPGQVFVLPH
jgi:nucleoid-associated protein YgaU